MNKFKVVDGHLTNVFYDGKGGFDCSNYNLTSLEGCPEEINGTFFCDWNNQLTTLEGGPKVVNGNFFCYKNNLTSLKGCPKIINGNFNCILNPNLEDISDLSEGVEKLNIGGCPNIKVFPRHIKDTLIICNISKPILERLKKQSHLEIIEEHEDFVTIREKSLGNQLLDAI